MLRRSLLSGLRVLVCLAIVMPVWLTAKGAEARPRRVVYEGRAPVTYQLELEPHLVLGADPPGPGWGSGVGIGARASVMVAPLGFLDRVNDSVAVGFGLDYADYDHSSAGPWIDGYRDQCLHREPGPAGTSICTDVTSYRGHYHYLYLPVVLQWSFWLHERVSVFGEPGLDLYHVGHHGWRLGPALYVGGRFLLTDRIAVVLRLGYPTSSLGASFLF